MQVPGGKVMCYSNRGLNEEMEADLRIILEVKSYA